VHDALVERAPPRDPLRRPASRPPLAGRATRVALVGAGYIADTHLAALRGLPAVEVVALCDVALERARAAAARHGVAHAVASLAELVGLSIDVVHLCVPPDLHVALARECLEHGFSVFVEKPLALSARDAEELFALARERGLALGANHNATFHPAFRRLLERLRQGAIGRLEHVDVQLAVPLRQLDARDYSHWMFRRPENIVFEQAVHPFSQLMELVGAPDDVHARVLSTRELGPGQPFHERWAVAARARGTTVQCSFSFGATFQESRLSVRGSDGALVADLHRNTLQEELKTQWLDFWDDYLAGRRRARGLTRDARTNLLRYLRQTLRLAPRGDAFFVGMRGAMAAFHAALRAGREPPGNARQVAGVLAWCEACTGELAPRPVVSPPPFSSTPPRAGEVVVLGANGFIGRHTLRALLERGAPATAAVRRAAGWPEDLDRAARSGALRLARIDLAQPEVLEDAVRGARTVIHLATGNGTSWEEVERAMVAGTHRLAEACLRSGVERLIYVSSIAALYLGPDCGTELALDAHPLDPRPRERALYARGKAAAEVALARLAQERGLAVTVVRPAVVLGADAALQHSGIGLWVRDNHCVGWGLGERPLPLVLVEDVADALARAALHAGHELDGRALNLAARVPLCARELVAGSLADPRDRQVARQAGRRPQGRLPELPGPEEPLALAGDRQRHRARGAGMAPVPGAGGLPGTALPGCRRAVSPRILHVFSTFAPGGPQVRTARLLPELDPTWKHAVLALDGCTDARTLLDPALQVEILEPPPRAGTVRTTRRLRRLLGELRPDLCLTYNWGALDALLAARLAGLRAVVHHEDGFRPDEVAGFKRRRIWARRLLLPGTRAVVVPSFRLEAIARELWRLPAERVVRIPNGIRVDDFPVRDGNLTRRAELGIPPSATVVWSVGHLRPEKNPVRLVEALAGTGAHLLMLGDGPERARVEGRARELGLEARVHLTGHRAAPQEDYSAMDVFALSSDTEQMPVALLEAMACALPVASTDVGDVRRILPPAQAAFVVPLGPEAGSALGRALAELEREPARRRALGAENRLHVEREYSFQRMLDTYRHTYRAALGAG